MAGSAASGGAAGTEHKNQITTIIAKIVVPARFRKIWPRCNNPSAIFRNTGRL